MGEGGGGWFYSGKDFERQARKTRPRAIAKKKEVRCKCGHKYTSLEDWRDHELLHIEKKYYKAEFKKASKI